MMNKHCPPNLDSSSSCCSPRINMHPTFDPLKKRKQEVLLLFPPSSSSSSASQLLHTIAERRG